MANKEIGRIGQRRYGGTIYEEFLHELRGTRGIEVYREMSEKCHCGSYAAGMQKQQYRILPGAQKQCNRTAEKSRKARKDFCKNRGRLQFTRESVLHPGWL